MKEYFDKKLAFKGQVLIFVALILFAMIAMVALILDGGDIMLNRRTAQAAADAGALAGAQRACYGYGDAETVAISYAEQNGATSVDVPVVTGSQVSVVATVENESFFAKIFGEDTLSASAEATAGCYSIIGKGVVPIAFYCEADTVGGGLPNHEYDCIMQGLDWDDELKPLKDGQTVNIDGTDYEMAGTNIVEVVDNNMPLVNYIYIIMDTDKICESDGGSYDCDINNDGADDLKFGGDRSWLYIDDDIDSLVNYIKTLGPETNITIRSHRWLSGDEGVQTSVYNQMVTNGWVGTEVLLPIYNYLCLGDPREGDPLENPCMIGAHASPWPGYPDPSDPVDLGDDFTGIRNKTDNYHILDFTPFYISCISTSGDCPGYQYAYNLSLEDENSDNDLSDNASIIEGYFIIGYEDLLTDGTRACDINLGNCIISLSD